MEVYYIDVVRAVCIRAGNRDVGDQYSARISQSAVELFDGPSECVGVKNSRIDRRLYASDNKAGSVSGTYWPGGAGGKASVPAHDKLPLHRIRRAGNAIVVDADGIRGELRESRSNLEADCVCAVNFYDGGNHGCAVDRHGDRGRIKSVGAIDDDGPNQRQRTDD